MPRRLSGTGATACRYPPSRALPLRSVILDSTPAEVNVETAFVAWSLSVQPVVPVLTRVFLNPAGVV